ncbi:helix-turn-helix transcriptional regulator [Caloramator sp. ALD01]|uniref:helix-turn-helix transcriptional regulator n=1 Tax=Caloramator sp. ALD01 TaxID=1031288 RepID=UPI000415E9A8|nr:helix-turn-helix transcriptional regulator [Caloramator sp. ALD01]
MVKNRLKEIRMREYMMNQKEFAEQVLKIDFRQYSRYEKGTVPSGETLLKIAKALNRKVEDIFYLEEE